MKRFGLCALTLIFCSKVWALGWKLPAVQVTGHELPKALQTVGVDDHRGVMLDPNLEFKDDEGRAVTLGEYFHSDKPLLLAMVYYKCPNLCSYYLAGLTQALENMKWTVGNQFNVIAVSMDPRETPAIAMEKKENYIMAYGRPESANGWHFLTGTPENIKKLTYELGFRYHWDAEKKQFAHVSVTYILTPQGQISRYLNGIDPDPTTLRLSMLEASGGKIGTFVDRAMMFCFRFDPHRSRYVLYAWNIMHIACILMVLLMASILIPVWWREFHHQEK